jgi:phospholipid-binding lipoprotein MlaA
MLKTLLNGSGKIVIVVALFFIFTGCAGTQKKINPQLPVTQAKHQLSDLNPDIKYPIADAYDPWEGFNRSIYKFNYHFDKYVYLPIVSGYEFIMPNFLEDRVSDFFRNIGDFKNLVNSILQLKGTATGTTLGRLVVNTTAGLGGFFDVATPMGLVRRNEDLGQTLGFYGAGPGPYLVLPILGPSSLRDTVGLVGDAAARTAVYKWIDPLENVQDKEWIEAGIFALEAIDKRHLESFRYYETGSPFEYELIRFLYLTKRKLDIGNNGEKQAD